jgi:hypothetical protein
MTPGYVFPTQALGPQSIQARVLGQALSGGLSLSGEEQFSEVGGGGRVVVDFGPCDLMTREAVLMWRRLVGAADGGARPIVVPLGDRLHQPVRPLYTGADTFGQDTWVADITAWAPDQVTATVSADAAVGATSISFTLTSPLALLGGEWFGALHPAFSWRSYNIIRVTAGGAGDGGGTTVFFDPPLREAIPAAQQLDFDNPRCLMRADGDLSETLSLLRFGKSPNARFVEYPGTL